MKQATHDGDVIPLEDLKSFSQATKLVPPARNGKPPHVATIGRWREPGVLARDGSRIRLRCVRVPSGWMTTIQWIGEFIEAMTNDRSGQGPTPPASLSQTLARRRRDLEEADRKLAAIGI
jgi:hypothetical protein